MVLTVFEIHTLVYVDPESRIYKSELNEPRCRSDFDSAVELHKPSAFQSNLTTVLLLNFTTGHTTSCLCLPGAYRRQFDVLFPKNKDSQFFSSKREDFNQDQILKNIKSYQGYVTL
jgi:hypothetical protein